MTEPENNNPYQPSEYLQSVELNDGGASQNGQNTSSQEGSPNDGDCWTLVLPDDGRCFRLRHLHGTTTERKRNEWTPTNLPHELEQFRVAHDDGSYPCGAFLGFFLFVLW